MASLWTILFLAGMSIAGMIEPLVPKWVLIRPLAITAIAAAILGMLLSAQMETFAS